MSEDCLNPIPPTDRWGTARKLVFGSLFLVVAFFLLPVVLSFAEGLLIMANPQFTPKHLIGLTELQMVQELGPPHYDPRQLGIQWSEDQYGPLVLSYRKGGAYCNISFKNGVVVAVDREWGD
jgi:hypothetical protein